MVLVKELYNLSYNILGTCYKGMERTCRPQFSVFGRLESIYKSLRIRESVAPVLTAITHENAVLQRFCDNITRYLMTLKDYHLRGAIIMLFHLCQTLGQ